VPSQALPGDVHAGASHDATGNLVDAATQASYKGIRETFKALMLGIGFGMGLEKLASKMTLNRINALPKEDQELLAKARFSSDPALLEKAAEVLDATKVVPGFWNSDTDADYPELQRASTYTKYHREFFAAYWAWRESVVDFYRDNGFYTLVDGWSLLGGEVRDTSVGNFPVLVEGICGDDPCSEMAGTVMDAAARLERRMIAARTKAALSIKKSHGEKTGGSVPFGFSLAADGVHLEPHPVEHLVLVRILDLRRGGLGGRKIARILANEGHRPRGARWNAGNLQVLADRWIAEGS